MKYKTKVMLCVGIALSALICGAYFIYQQRTHFNENITINGINVGGLNAKEAQEKLTAAKVEKKVNCSIRRSRRNQSLAQKI